jgi:radical SAM protein
MFYWELTRACDLACRHCRAEAISSRHPEELSTQECIQLLRVALGFGAPLPHLVLTGGDPLKRPDLFEVVAEARDRGFRVSLAPSGTPLLTHGAIRQIAESGVHSMSLSLDGSTAELHDAFRGVPGCFASTLQAGGWIRDSGIPLQINTLVTADTLGDLPALYERMLEMGIARWSLFFLIATGRGRALREIEPAESERLFHWLYDLSRSAPFEIKTTEATHYRRVALVRMRSEGIPDATIARTPVGRGFGVRDGNGILFVSHTGDVYPSGFLPLWAGNARTASIVDIYRGAELFTRLRDVTQLSGRCGVCPFQEICGGSRARAYAWTGDCMASDPLCPYRPQPHSPIGSPTYGAPPSGAPT